MSTPSSRKIPAFLQGPWGNLLPAVLWVVCLTAWLPRDPTGEITPFLFLGAAFPAFLLPRLSRKLSSFFWVPAALVLLSVYLPGGDFPAAALGFLLLSALFLARLTHPGREEETRLPWNPGAWAAALAAGLAAGRIAPELHTLDPCSTWWVGATWSALSALLLLGYLLVRWGRGGRTAGLLLLAFFPLGLSRTLAGLEALSVSREAVKMVNALAVTLGSSTEPPPPLDPLAGPLWTVYPKPGILLLLQASLAALPLLLLGGAAAAFDSTREARPSPALRGGLFALGALLAPLAGWPLLAAIPPILALVVLLVPDPGAEGTGGSLPGRKRLLPAAALCLAAAFPFLFLHSPPLLAAPLSLGGLVPKKVPAGRLATGSPPGISFLDGLPLRRPGGQLYLLEGLPGESRSSLCLAPPNFRMPPPWTTRSLLEQGTLEEALAGSPWRDVLLALPCPDHRFTASLLSREDLTLLAARAKRLWLALDLGSLGRRRIPILAERLLGTGKEVAFFLALGGFTPPLLVARLGPPGGGLPPTLHRAADPERVRALAGLAGPAFLEPWTFQAPMDPEPHHGRVRRALLLLAGKALPGKGPRPGVAALMRALAARWKAPPPPDTVGQDPDRALLPGKEELRLLTEGMEKDPVPVLLEYAEMVGDHLLKPTIQRLGLARPFFRKWAELLPNRPAFARLLGTLHERLLEYDQALPLLEKAWKLGKGNRKTLRELGLTLFGLKKYHAAAARLLALSPDPARDLEAARALGLSLFETKNPKAAEWIEKVRSLDPWDKEVREAARVLGIK